MPEQIEISNIVIDCNLQQRGDENLDTIALYAEAMLAGDIFPETFFKESVMLQKIDDVKACSTVSCFNRMPG